MAVTLVGADRLERSLMACMMLLGYLGPASPLRKSTNLLGLFCLGLLGLHCIVLLTLGGDLDLGGLLDLTGLPAFPGLLEPMGDLASLQVRSSPLILTSTLLSSLAKVEVGGNLDRGPLAEGRMSFLWRLKSLSRPSWMTVERSLRGWAALGPD